MRPSRFWYSSGAKTMEKATIISAPAPTLVAIDTIITTTMPTKAMTVPIVPSPKIPGVRGLIQFP